ncbi:MAG: hypothetical protein R3E32_15680 [Chitinophagales bacterium]
MKFFNTLLLLLMFVGLPLWAQDTAAVQSEKESEDNTLREEAIAANHALFEAEDVLELTLTTDLKAVKKDIGEEREYHPATISYLNEEGKTVNVELKVKTRGNSRRSKDMCNFPPLRLNFNDEQSKGTIFEGQNKVKLVAHCQDNDDNYKEYVLREYFVYKAFQALTDKSFRVRLLKMTYVDSEDKNEKMEKYGFIIEGDDFLAARMEGKMLEDKKIHAENTDKPIADRVAIFQFMIGNLDWSVQENHNMKICYNIGGLPYCIPYDFDLTGIVDAEYALPPEMLPVNTVRDRLYRGFCRTPEEFEVAFEEFRAAKDAIYAIYNESELLSEKYVNNTIKYLDDFYEIINNPKLVKQHFLKKCRRAE